ncbi:MAG: DJ-1 family glyoxalase III [Fusobacteriaceae bacterium]
MKDKIFVMLGTGFELIEAMAPVDVLRRAGLNVITVSTADNASVEVESAQKVTVLADINIKDMNSEEGVMVVIPGGFPGYVNLRENTKVVEIVKNYLSSNKLVGAICGGPTVLGVNGLINDYSFVCHSSVKNEMSSNKYQQQDVVIDRNLITSPGAGKSIEFGLALASKFVDKDVIEKIKKGMELI